MREDGKTRAVRVLMYLYENTDEEHYATIKMISDHLASLGMPADRRTIGEDIEALRAAGIDISCERSTQNRFRLASRSFSVTELKLLIDAVQSSKFIGYEDCRILIEKLASLAVRSQSGKLRRRLYFRERPKAGSKDLFRTLDLVWRAYCEGVAVSFKYFTFDSGKRRVYKHSGATYMLSVYSMIWNNDSYYVVGYDEKHRGVTTFRLDRMGEVMLTDTPARKAPAGFTEQRYMKGSVFDMYDGREYDAAFICRGEAMDAVIDKFGKDADTTPCGRDKFILRTRVSASPTLYGWLFTFTDLITLISPSALAKDYSAYMRGALASLREGRKIRQRRTDI